MINLKWKKSIAVLLVLLLCIAPLAACGDRGASEDTFGTDAPETPEATPVASGEGLDLQTVMVEVSGASPILWGELYYDLQIVNQTFGIASFVEDWDAPLEWHPDYEGLTYGEFMIQQAVERALERRAAEKLFHEMGETLDPNFYADARQEYLEVFAMDDEEFAELLAAHHMTEVVFQHLTEVSGMVEQTTSALFGEEGADISQADLDAFITEHNVLRAKHILVMADMDSIADGEAQVSTSPLANELYAELQGLSGEELFARFDEMIAEYGEDPGMTMNPDGYTFLPGAMVDEFFEGTLALSYYEFSVPIRSGFGYHIILRLPVEYDANVMGPGGVQALLPQMAANVLMQDKLSEVQARIQYEITSALRNLDLAEVFD